jgi:hypothetical protein
MQIVHSDEDIRRGVGAGRAMNMCVIRGPLQAGVIHIHEKFVPHQRELSRPRRGGVHRRRPFVGAIQCRRQVQRDDLPANFAAAVRRRMNVCTPPPFAAVWMFA